MKLFIFSILVLAFGMQAQAQNNVTWLSHDFAVSEAPANWAPAKPFNGLTANLSDDELRNACEAHLRAAVCVTNENTQAIAGNWSGISCDANSAEFLPSLMGLYDEMPARMRPLYCSLSRIFLSDNIPSTAFASAITKNGAVAGAFVGARKAGITADISSGALVTWKEQLIFGGSETFLSNDPKLVQEQYNLRMTNLRSDALFYVLMHELGHVVDFENQVNAQPRKYGWAAMSWSGNSPKKEARYLLQEKICFYQCASKISPDKAYDIYQSLAQSSFITTYSGMNPYEDFAEYWAWNIMREFKDPRFLIQVPGQPEIDMTAQYSVNPKFTAKFDLVRKIWNAPETKIGF